MLNNEKFDGVVGETDPMSELDKQMKADAKKKKKVFLAVGGALLTLVIVVGSVLIVKQINKNNGIPAPDSNTTISAVSDSNVPMDGIPDEIADEQEKEALDNFEQAIKNGLEAEMETEIVADAVEVDGGVMGTNIKGETIFIPDEVYNADKTMLSDPLKGIWNDADFDPYTGEWIKDWPASNEEVEAIADETGFRQCLAEGDEEGIQWYIENKNKKVPEDYQGPVVVEGMDPHNPTTPVAPPSYLAPDGSGYYDNPNLPDKASEDAAWDALEAELGIDIGGGEISPEQAAKDQAYNDTLAGLEWT